MDKLVDGLFYSTRDATWITTRTRGKSSVDPQFRMEALYKTKKRRWFLHTESGPYRTDDIVPLAEPEAAKWLAETDMGLAMKLFPKHIRKA